MNDKLLKIEDKLAEKQIKKQEILAEFKAKNKAKKLTITERIERIEKILEIVD